MKYLDYSEHSESSEYYIPTTSISSLFSSSACMGRGDHWLQISFIGFAWHSRVSKSQLLRPAICRARVAYDGVNVVVLDGVPEDPRIVSIANTANWREYLEAVSRIGAHGVRTEGD